MEVKEEVISDYLPSVEKVVFSNLTHLTLRRNSLHLMKHMDVVIDHVQEVTVEPEAIVFKPIIQSVKVQLNFVESTFNSFPQNGIKNDYSDIEGQVKAGDKNPRVGVNATNVRVLCDCSKTGWFANAQVETITPQLQCIGDESFREWENTCSAATSITFTVGIFLLPAFLLLRSTSSVFLM